MTWERATIEQVKVILPSGTQLTNEQIQAAIDAAECQVEQIASGCASGLSDKCLTQVHIYLSAHVAACTENTLSLSSETDPCCGGRATYGFKFGEGVKGTPFGQQANSISGGCLAELDKQPARLFSIGSH